MGASSATQCAQCPAAAFSAATAASACASCGAGAYMSGAGASRCDACPAGTFAAPQAAGVSACAPCPAGAHAQRNGSSACAQCTAGTYAPPGTAACLPCPDGTYATAAGADVCPWCRVGTYRASGARAESGCAFCSGGTYAAAAGASACATCTFGSQFSDVIWATACQWCPGGSYSKYPGVFNSASAPTKCWSCAYGPIGESNTACVTVNITLPLSLSDFTARRDDYLAALATAAGTYADAVFVMDSTEMQAAKSGSQRSIVPAGRWRAAGASVRVEALLVTSGNFPYDLAKLNSYLAAKGLLSATEIQAVDPPAPPTPSSPRLQQRRPPPRLQIRQQARSTVHSKAALEFPLPSS